MPAVLLKDRVRGGRRRVLVLLMWAGCVLLALRGASGLLDDLLRDAGLSSTGITGMTDTESLGTAHPSAYTQLTAASVDAYFAVGGVLYGWAARASRAAAQRTGR